MAHGDEKQVPSQGKVMRTRTDMVSLARDVLDGFKRPSEQLARDVLALARELDIIDRQKAGEAFRNAGSGPDVPDFMKGLFR